MKRLLLALACVVSIALPAMPAQAVAPVVAAPVIWGGASAASVGFVAVGTTLLPTFLFTMAALNVDPWTPIFGKEHVFYEYPGQNVYPKPLQVAYRQPTAPYGGGPYHRVINGVDVLSSD